MDIEALTKLSELDPEFVEAEKTGPKLPTSTDIQFWKKMGAMNRDNTYAALGPPPAGITEADHEAEMRDGKSIIIRSYTPDKAPEGGSPLIVMFHGGGFAIGGLENEQASSRDLAVQLGAVVLSVDYRLAPENPFPTPVNDAWDSVKWAAKNAATLKATPSKGFVVGGASAGGNLAAVVTHLARNEKLSPPLTGQFLVAPLLIPPTAVPEKYKSQYISYEQNNKSAILSSAMMNMFNKAHKSDDKSPLFAVFNDPSGHADLPPAYIQICGADMLRDDAILYERVLREDYNIPTRVDMYAGLPHMFWAVYPTLKKSTQRKTDTVEGVKWLLEQR